MRTLIYREEAREMADAHAQGLHDGLRRDFCPECDHRELNSYPSYAALLRVRYVPEHLSVSTDTELTASGKRKARQQPRWGVFYRGRLLHGGLATSDEANTVKGWYAEGLPPDSAYWKLITSPGKKPSPSTDDIRRAMR